MRFQIFILMNFPVFIWIMTPYSLQISTEVRYVIPINLQTKMSSESWVKCQW
jgi:hypothetical protein